MSAPRRALGFGWPVLVLLAALAAPRVVLHDLGVVEEGTLVNGLLVVVPPACWIAAVVWRRPRRPFLTVVVIGALYGVLLAAGHQLLWDAAFPGGPPTVGRLDPATGAAVLRTAAAVSSLVTGTLVGVVAGAVALLLTRLVRTELEADRPAPSS
ncbi:hypothetical protein PHK61_02965 [Actinomycetospora lutea]|uniref:hypothetical protein n=1 Tax=Actinomycetospora lutea TaxID=663604 RepID=UPI002366CBC6|nr:hypothetical protein [Actinomycetospora lutea]MDD7937377.1 hypothetical protein [Actinomycetospora lutea]